jgi:hypothetical protein
MSNTVRIFVTIILLSAMLGCEKKKVVPPTPDPPKEENIVFSIDPDPGSGVAVALSGTYAFKVNVSSKLTTSGVKVDLTTKKDADNNTVDSKNLDSNIPGIDLSTGILNPGILCTVSVTVTSKITATNTVTKSFKVARK